MNFVLYDWQTALKEIKKEIELKNIELEENKDHLNKNKIWKLNEELKELKSNSEKDENINQKIILKEKELESMEQVDIDLVLKLEKISKNNEESINNMEGSLKILLNSNIEVNIKKVYKEEKELLNSNDNIEILELIKKLSNKNIFLTIDQLKINNYEFLQYLLKIHILS